MVNIVKTKTNNVENDDLEIKFKKCSTVSEILRSSMIGAQVTIVTFQSGFL